MKTLKIIIGFLLIYATGIEYIDASRELGSLLSLGIIIGTLAMLLLTTWLIGSEFSVRKFRFKSFEAIKFFIISFVTFGIIVIFHLGSTLAPIRFFETNGLKVPLGKCVDGNKNYIPDEKERMEYCKCLIEKITADPELKFKHQDKLENDQFISVFNEIQNSSKFMELGIEDCISSINIKWTDNIANSMKQNLKNELVGTEFEETNYIDQYCDCLIKEYRKFPMDKIFEEGFTEGEVAITIDEKCTKLSKK